MKVNNYTDGVRRLAGRVAFALDRDQAIAILTIEFVTDNPTTQADAEKAIRDYLWSYGMAGAETAYETADEYLSSAAPDEFNDDGDWIPRRKAEALIDAYWFDR